MEKIQSFVVDHRKISEGVYVSRVDSDITTYDLRMRKPNGGDYLDNATMHSLEHMFATFIRNSKVKDNVIYFGPMGCQTGFYLLLRNSDRSEIVNIILETLKKIIEYNGEMFGNSEIECGNYRNLDLILAKKEAARYLEIIKNKTESDLIYI